MRHCTSIADVLGLEHVGETAVPDGGTMQRLMCGRSVVELLSLAANPDLSNLQVASGPPPAFGTSRSRS